MENGDIPNVMRYSTEIDKTVEAYDSYVDLYLVIREKMYNIDRVLDDIISFNEDPES